MTWSILRATTAIALGFSLTAPSAILAANPRTETFQVAQSNTDGKTGKAKGRNAEKAGETELCADGTEPPCAEAAKEAVDEAVKEKGRSAEAQGRAKKAEEAAQDAAPAQAQEAAPATAEAAPSNAPVDETKAEPAAADAAPKPEQERAPAAAEAAPVEPPAEERGEAGKVKPPRAAEAERGKKREKARAAAEEQAAPAAQEPVAASEPKADATPTPDEETKEAPAPAAAESKDASPTADAAPDPAPAATTAEESAPRGEHQKSAATDEQAAPVEVTSESVTEETTRSSDEEVVVAKPRDGKKDKSDDLVKILGAAAGGVVVGALLNEALGGGKVVESTGDRVIIERNGEYIVRKDENEILRRPGSDVRTERFSDGSSRTVVERQDGVRVETIRDADGYVVRRSRILPDGREILLLDDTRDTGRVRIERDQLPRFDRSVPHRRYIEYSAADRGELRKVLMTRPIARFDRGYTLRQVREIEELRDAMPRLDLDVITFDTGSAAIAPRQARKLDPLGWAMQDILAENPDEVFLIEGHTDAVGSRYSNLILSDRRAETVALALTEYYDIPPENLITQGYGEEFLKIETDQAERANRRAAVRRITPLLDRTATRR